MSDRKITHKKRTADIKQGVSQYCPAPNHPHGAGDSSGEDILPLHVRDCSKKTISEQRNVRKCLLHGFAFVDISRVNQ